MSSLLRLASLVCSLVLIGSFAMFAADEARSGSKDSLSKIAAATGAGPGQSAKQSPSIDMPNPSPKVERLRERKHSSFRELVDDGNDILVGPFKGAVTSNSIWVQRIVPGLIAFLVFGLGLGFAARLVSIRGA